MGLSHSPTIVTDGLVLCLDAANARSYPGAGTTWTDRSANGNDGTLTNGPTFDSANGGSIVFDGSDDFVDIPTMPFTAASSLTVSAWFMTNNTTANQTIVSLEESIGYFRLEISTHSPQPDEVFGYYYDGSHHAVGSTSITAGVWYLGAWVKNGTNYSFYVNGVLKGTDGGANPYSGTGIEGIGSRATSGVSEYKMNGRIATCRIYSRALTADEVRRNYLATKGRFE